MKELFRASRDSLGSRTLGENLRNEGFKTGRDRTRRLMKKLNLEVKQKRKYKVTTDSKHQLPVAENVLNRQFSPQAPNQAWGTDITYLWTQQGFFGRPSDEQRQPTQAFLLSLPVREYHREGLAQFVRRQLTCPVRRQLS